MYNKKLMYIYLVIIILFFVIYYQHELNILLFFFPKLIIWYLTTNKKEFLKHRDEMEIKALQGYMDDLKGNTVNRFYAPYYDKGFYVKKWDCKSDYYGRQQNAGLSSGYFFDHVRAEFNEPSHTGSFVRNDQWKNFLKANYPSRPGITNLREKGVNMHIATFLGDCSGGDYNNAGGSYLIDEIVWP